MPAVLLCAFVNSRLSLMERRMNKKFIAVQVTEIITAKAVRGKLYQHIKNRLQNENKKLKICASMSPEIALTIDSIELIRVTSSPV